ncbi:MAG TPA: class I SAM-dependent methyltransferase, partial [Candidatus Binatia bacterium]|nr:class I SAM-dependent methyltransferase [Candidatus Binatia bacterium]
MSGPSHRGAMDDPHGSHSLILARLGAGHGRRILDVGAGEGLLADRLTGRGWEVTVLERDPGLAARARGRCREVVVADLERGLPALAGPYHAAVYGGVLQHLSDPLWVLRGLNRAMTPDALVIASVPNVAHVWVRLSLLLGRFEYSDRGILDRSHLRFFTRKSFLDLLEDAGLVVSEFLATPIPLREGPASRWRRAAHAGHAAAARCWAGGLGYEFVALSTLAVTERAVLPAAWRDP